MDAIRCFLVTYLRSSIADEMEFESRLKTKLAKALVCRCPRQEKVHVGSRFYGVRETRMEHEGEVTCSHVHRYEVVVLFDEKVSFEEHGDAEAMFGIGDGSRITVEHAVREPAWDGRLVPVTDEYDQLYLMSCQDCVEREVTKGGVERCLFGTRFDEIEEFPLGDARGVSILRGMTRRWAGRDCW
jgi:hypothetical protein